MEEEETISSGKNELSRSLTGRQVEMIAIGGAIGTGLFLGAGKSIHLAGPAILLAYLLTGIICFWIMRALGELLLSDLKYHSFVETIYDYLGKRTAFVIGWSYWASWIAIAMAELTAIGVYIKLWIPNLPQWVPGLITLIILVCINLITVKAFGEVEFWFALIKVFAILALIVVGIFLIIFRYKTSAGVATPTNLIQDGGFFARGWQGFFMSLPMVVFAFVGIEMIGMTAAEVQDPKKIIPKAINSIPLRILIFYIGSLAVIMSIFPWTGLDPSSSPFVMVFKELGIQGAVDIVNFVVITAAASSCNSALFTTGRMLSELTSQSKSPRVKKVSKLSIHHVPSMAILLSSILIALSTLLNILMPNDVFSLITGVATTSFLFIWGTIILAHLKFRKKHPKNNFFKMPFSPVSDYIVLVFFVIVAVMMAFEKSTLISLIFALIWFSGLFILSKRHSNLSRDFLNMD
ncbi:amino acid permease [Companilactobacillus furfuricola]|uniref:amino acid permease n=1 Tax=Companilactobacillus furfuricola TaxID=1462575 RepID=UPI000F767AF3